jgi:hypothetical protein
MSIQRIPYSAPREEFISALKRDGCVIVQNFTTLETLAQARREVEPYLNRESNSEVGGESHSYSTALNKYTAST